MQAGRESFLYKLGGLRASALSGVRRSYGLDLSRWQGVIDFDAMFSPTQDPEIEFVYIKATEGVSYQDPMFERNANELMDGHQLWGGYHFWRPSLNPLDQAASFYETMEMRRYNMVPVVDIEAHSDFTNAQTAKALHSFLVNVEQLFDERPIIYTAAWWWNRYIGSVAPDWQKDYRFWLASWPWFPNPETGLPTLPRSFTSHASPQVVMWQYTSTGPGQKYGCESRGLDMNVTLVDIDELIVEPVVPPPPPPPDDLKERVDLLEDQMDDLSSAFVSVAREVKLVLQSLTTHVGDSVKVLTDMQIKDQALEDRISKLEAADQGPEYSAQVVVPGPDKAARFTWVDRNANGMPIVNVNLGEPFDPGSSFAVFPNPLIIADGGRKYYKIAYPGGVSTAKSGDALVRADRITFV